MDQLSLQEGEQHIATAVEHGPDAQEDQEQLAQPDLARLGPERGERGEQGQRQPHRQAPGAGGPGDMEAGGEQAATGQDDELVHSDEVRGERGRGNDAEQDRLGDGGPQLEQGLDDDGDDDRLDAVEHAAQRQGVAVGDVDPGEGPDDHRGGGDEAHAGHDQAPAPGAVPAEVDGQLGAVGPGDQVGRADEVDEALVADPAPTADDLVVHHRDVPGRAAEGRDPQP
jgi:hypothetical protein